MIYPTRISLNRSFGWDGDVNAMGFTGPGPFAFYHRSLDRGGENRELIFKERGPLAHEFAHLGGLPPAAPPLVNRTCLLWKKVTGCEFEGPDMAGRFLSRGGDGYGF